MANTPNTQTAHTGRKAAEMASIVSLFSFACAINDPKRAGERASAAITFGDCRRFELYAVHTRFSAVSWFLADRSLVDPVTDSPAIIRQEPTPEAALADFIGGDNCPAREPVPCMYRGSVLSCRNDCPNLDGAGRCLVKIADEASDWLAARFPERGERAGCAHESTTTPDGHGAFCRHCGKTMA